MSIAPPPVRPTARFEYTTPIALRFYKRSRWCTVCKLTDFYDNRPILAVAWENQTGTDHAISLPVAALDLAESVGATDFYLQDRRRWRMWTCAIATFRTGRLAGGEYYVPLAWLTETTYRDWRFASQTLDLTPASRQLTLFGDGGGR